MSHLFAIPPQVNSAAILHQKQAGKNESAAASLLFTS